MVKTSVNLRLDSELLSAIKDKAARESTTQTALIEQGMRLVLGMASSVETSAQIPVETIRQTVEALLDTKIRPSVESIVQEYVKMSVGELSSKISGLEAAIAELHQNPVTIPPRSSSIASDQESIEEQPDPGAAIVQSDLARGLSQKELCSRFEQLNAAQFARNARRYGGKLQLIKAKTGTDWKFVDGRYYPVGNHDNRYDHLAR